MLSLSSQNLSKLDEIICDLKKYSFLFKILTSFDVTDLDNRNDFNEWQGLLFDCVDLNDQLVNDLRVLDSCIRKGSDFD